MYHAGRQKQTYLEPNFNKLDKESHLIFLDFTGLYSSQMLEPLPVGEYKYFGKNY